MATTRREDLVAAWDVVLRRFGGADPPGTLLGATVPESPGRPVEVEVVAVVGGR